MTSIGIGRVWGNGIRFGIFTQLIDSKDKVPVSQHHKELSKKLLEK